MKKRITGILVLLMMAVIFCFSAQPGEDSAQVSHSAAYRIARWQAQAAGQEKTEEELAAQAEAMQLFVRKCAHMSEYALLAFLLALHLNCYFFNKGRTLLLAWAFAVCYAVSDEFHQIFVPGRAGRVTDVGIDSIGALFGIAAAALLLKRQNRRKQQKP